MFDHAVLAPGNLTVTEMTRNELLANCRLQLQVHFSISNPGGLTRKTLKCKIFKKKYPALLLTYTINQLRKVYNERKLVSRYRGVADVNDGNMDCVSSVDSSADERISTANPELLLLGAPPAQLLLAESSSSRS